MNKTDQSPTLLKLTFSWGLPFVQILNLMEGLTVRLWWQESGDHTRGHWERMLGLSGDFHQGWVWKRPGLSCIYHPIYHPHWRAALPSQVATCHMWLLITGLPGKAISWVVCVAGSVGRNDNSEMFLSPYAGRWLPQSWPAHSQVLFSSLCSHFTYQTS